MQLYNTYFLVAWHSSSVNICVSLHKNKLVFIIIYVRGILQIKISPRRLNLDLKQ